MGLFERALVSVINAVIQAVAAVATTVMSLLPQLPAPPSSVPSAVAQVNWLVPIGGIAAEGAAFVTLYVLFLAMRLVMRWVKAL